MPCSPCRVATTAIRPSAVLSTCHGTPAHRDARFAADGPLPCGGRQAGLRPSSSAAILTRGHADKNDLRQSSLTSARALLVGKPAATPRQCHAQPAPARAGMAGPPPAPGNCLIHAGLQARRSPGIGRCAGVSGAGPRPGGALYDGDNGLWPIGLRRACGAGCSGACPCGTPIPVTSSAWTVSRACRRLARSPRSRWPTRGTRMRSRASSSPRVFTPVQARRDERKCRARAEMLRVKGSFGVVCAD